MFATWCLLYIYRFSVINILKKCEILSVPYARRRLSVFVSLDKFRDGENAGVKGCREWNSLDLHDTFDVIQHYRSR